MRLIFFGTPEFAVPSLRALHHAEHDIVGVVTQPDRPRGRSRSHLVPPAAKIAAQHLNLPVLQPERPVGDLFAAQLRRLAPDLGVVVAYGHILRPEILATPALGMINVHASVLPRWRGAAPIQAAILAGDDSTGVSIMQMEEGLDTGPVLLALETPIAPGETFGTLNARLAELGATAVLQAVEQLTEGTAAPEPQDDAAASYAPKVTRTMAHLDWTAPAPQLARQVRAFDPAPGAWTSLDGQMVKMFEGRAVENGGALPGTVVAAGDLLTVACGSGALELRMVQPAGKKPLSVAEWVRGRGIEAGQRFE
ncbi:MAG TPA: methionyl-tRNA formyltransferase [Gemmatimonadales bacterium]|nr:methionyl-tRNA formyltransferase [Gemmatimonadales bacterium]